MNQKDDDALLARRLTELAQRSYSTCSYTASDFLTTAQQNLLAGCMVALPHIPWSSQGGHPSCERRLAYFGSPELCGYDQPPPIACVKVSPRNVRFSEPLTHRDYLGALMALGVRREVTGDIFVSGADGYIFCTDQIAPYIVQSLESVGHVQVVCQLMEDGLPELTIRSESMRVNVASQRLDAVLSAVWGLSRSESAALFPAGKVSVNARLRENPSTPLKEGDSVSVRGLGRFVYRGTDNVTRKGRLFILVDKLI